MAFTEQNHAQKSTDRNGRKNISMEIVADGMQANENPAAWYRGLGCITANNSSRLLLDYKVEHPKEYEEIMRLLFQKDYGAGLRHIKIELGADINSSSGTEPATKRSPEEHADVTRGAGFQFAADAKAINPDITLDLLRWGEPGWITKAFTFSQQQGFEARYDWYRETLIEAFRIYGLRFDFISADANETDSPDEAWILYLRYRLDNDKDAPYDFRKIRLVASDENGTRNISAQMIENHVLRNAVDVIGLHYTTYGDSYTNLLNEAYGKEIWYSEGDAPSTLSHLTVQADQSGLIGKNSAIDVANRIINSYYNGKMCMYEFQTAISASYDGSCNTAKHLIRACEPWSGHYQLDSGFWMAMHFNRFTPANWMFVNGACYGDGEENHFISNTTNNFMTLVSPDRTEMTMHFTNEDDTARIYSVLVKDMAFDSKVLSTVITTGPNGDQPYNANWFVRGKPIRPSHRTGETYLIKVPPRSIMTVTTLNTEWVNGVETFQKHAPKPERLALPYQDDFQYRPNDLVVRGCAPKYMADQGGAFELIHSDQDGEIVCQRITRNRIPTNWRFRNTPDPVTTLGDDRWRSYSAEIDVRLDSSMPDTYAGLGVRYNSAVTCELSARCGYSALLYGDGSWKLLDMDHVAAEGKLMRIRGGNWNRIKLLVLGDSILFFVNGNLVTSYRPQCIINSGRISLLSSYDMNTFRNLQVEPMPILPLYVRRVDCFSEGIFYNENWEVCPTEKYTFYNRTAMRAFPNAAFSCKFTGTGIAVIGTAKDALFDVTVDDVPFYSEHFVSYAAPRQACLVIDQLPPGEHVLYVSLISGDFKLDVLEVPDNHVMMPDTLQISPAALAAAQEREYQRHQQRLAQKQAAEAAAIALEQAVSGTAKDTTAAAPAQTAQPAPEAAAPVSPAAPQTTQPTEPQQTAAPAETTAAPAAETAEPDTEIPETPAETEAAEPETTEPVRSGKPSGGGHSSFASRLKSFLMGTPYVPEAATDDNDEYEASDEEYDEYDEYEEYDDYDDYDDEDEEDEIIPEFAALKTPDIAPTPTEPVPSESEALASLLNQQEPETDTLWLNQSTDFTEEPLTAAETPDLSVSEPVTYAEPQTAAAPVTSDAETVPLTETPAAATPEQVYRSVLSQLPEPEPVREVVTPTPAPAPVSLPKTAPVLEDDEESPVYRPNFNIDINI